MSENTLDDLGRETLESIAGRRVDRETLASDLDASRADLAERLAQLVDNGLVREVDGRYEATDDGERLRRATPVGVRDDRIDTPRAVERAIEGFDRRPDKAAAIRAAVAFLRYWGEATAAEIVDAIYGEHPAGYDAPDRWWRECVRDRLEALPGIRRETGGALGERLTYAGEATVDVSGADGRDAPDPAGAPPAVGSARHALESAELSTPERRAARSAFETLAARGRASTATLLEGLGGDAPTGLGPERLTEALDAIPGVEREAGPDDTAIWTYGPSDGGAPT